MKKYLEFKNTGEVETQAFVLMGASTKRDNSSQIGYFGSGLKYALAYLTRNDIDFNIFSGDKEIVVKRRKEKLRGVDYTSLVIDGRRTSITTEMGPDWTLWHAIREIYCNALDENGCMIETDVMAPGADTTTIYIENNDKITELLNRWDNYFCSHRQDRVTVSDDWEVFTSKDKLILYRKGIRVFKPGKDSLYDYNLDDIRINESRVIQYSWEAQEKLSKYWGLYANETMIRKLLDNINTDVYERELHWEYAKDYNDNWLKVIGSREIIHRDLAGYFADKVKNGGLVLPSRLIKSLSQFFGDRIKVVGQSDYSGNYVVLTPTTREEYLIKETLKFFKEVGLEISYPIKVSVFRDKSILGKAEESEIILSRNVLEMGKKVIASTILEETFHIESGRNDESRGFQDFIINKVLTLLENKNGVFL